MQPLRLLIAPGRGWFAVAGRGWLIALLACTLTVRLLVPTGFMPMVVEGTVTFQPCSGVMPAPTAQGPPAMHGMGGMTHHPEEAGVDEPGADEPRVEMPCSFAGMGAAALGSAPPILLAAAIAFVFLGVLRLAAQILPEPPRLRPPLRAPPLTV